MAREIGFDSEQVGDIELSVGEAISNAIKYGCAHDSRSRVVIRFHQFSDKFVAEISDCGCGFDPVEMKCSPSEHLIEGGRGIHFIKSFMDEVSFTFCGGTTVRMTKLLRSSDERHACKNANSLDVG
jgi:serine/threonine-protein kinase RsbW